MFVSHRSIVTLIALLTAGEVPEAAVLPALRAGPALLQEQEERRGQLWLQQRAQVRW